MDGDGYTYRAICGYTTSNGTDPRTERWSKTSYTSDHVHQPVFIGADGRRKPIISYTPDDNTEYYVTKTEIVEVPYVTEYKQSTPVRVDVLRDYGDVEGKRNRPLSPEKWRKCSSPVRYHAEENWNRPSSPVRYQWVKPSSPARYRAEEKWVRPPGPVRYHAEEKWINRPSSPVQERPQEIEEFITKIQTQASQPNKFGPLSATYWRQTPNSNTGYGDQSDLSNKEWQKPSGNSNTFRSENYDGPYKRDNILEPTMATTGGSWPKPSHGRGWSKGQRANLSEPTSDINTAMENLKQAVKLSSGITPPPPRYTTQAPTGPKRDAYPDTTDNREAARMYGSLNVAPRPIDNSTRTIDSREAARKYGSLNVAPRPIDNSTRFIDSREAAKKYGGTTV